MAPVVREPRRGEDADLFARYHRDRDPRDRELLVERYLPLARSLSRKFFAAGEREDLEQVAAVGLLKAIERFDPARNLAFTSFALPTILGELKRYFRDHGWSVRVPRSLQELAPRVQAATAELVGELGRAPTIAEIGERCDASPEHVLEARMLGSAHRAMSLDAPVTDEEALSRIETLGEEDAGYARAETAIDLERLLTAVPEREQQILQLRFGDDLTQREIAERVGLSQMHVSRLLRATLSELAAAQR